MATPISAKSKGFAPVNQLPAAQKVLEGQRLALTGVRVSDADAGDTTISVTLSVAHGSLSISPTSGVTLTSSNDGSKAVLVGSQADINKALGTLTYTPTAFYNGPDTLTITSSDRGNTSGSEQIDTDKLAITVLPVNDAPTASNRSFTTKEDIALVLKAVDFGFRDTDGHALAAVKIVSLPTNGTLLYKGVAISASKIAAGFEVSAKDLTAGSLTFVAAKNANGMDYASFQFQVRDTGGTANGGKDTSTVQTVTISVTAVNDGPAAADDSAFASPVRPATGFVLGNDTDVEGNSLLVTGVGVGAETTKAQKLVGVELNTTGTSIVGKYGVLTIKANGEYSYAVDPNDPDYIKLKGGSATESFTYQISDGNGGSDKATLAIKVTAPNRGPVAVDDTVIVNSTTVAAKALTNDFDADGDRLIVTRVGAGTEGQNAGNPNGMPSIAPNPLQALSNGLAIKGQLGSLSVKSDGSYSYQVDQTSESFIALGRDATAIDSFTYEISDGRGGVDRATLNVRVKGINDNPEARSDFGYEANFFYYNTDLSDFDGYNNALYNDSDIDVGDSLVVTKVGAGIEVSKLVQNQEGIPPTVVAGKFGFLSIFANGDYSYRTDPNSTAFKALARDGIYEETFSYEASDGKGGTSKAQITVAFRGPNDAPVATDDAATALRTGDTGTATFTVIGNALENDSDNDSGFLLVAAGAGNEAANTVKALTPVPGFIGNTGIIVNSGLNIEGKYGTLYIEQNGNYYYSANNTDDDLKKLGQG